VFFYVPAVTDAYFDMHEIRTSVAFGQFVRNIHRWAAHLMVVVFLPGAGLLAACKAPRQFSWVIGVWLLLLTLPCRSPATSCRGISSPSGR
jgi:quinol-cytochrome oxidoreductase complex cytochrome b subunit